MTLAKVTFLRRLIAAGRRYLVNNRQKCSRSTERRAWARTSSRSWSPRRCFRWACAATSSSSGCSRHQRRSLPPKTFEAAVKCRSTLFVFDLADKIPVGLLETITTYIYIGYNQDVEGVDFRAIFIFLSNSVGGVRQGNDMMK